MKLSTQLIHFNAQTAVCLATVEEGEKRVSVYASAQANEAGNYADLAQQRSLQLAWQFFQEGDALLQDNSLLVATPTVQVNIARHQSISQKSITDSNNIPEPPNDVPVTKLVDDELGSGNPWQ